MRHLFLSQPSPMRALGQARTVVPPPVRSIPRSEPHSEPAHIVPRPSSPALCQSDAKGYLLPDYYSGATGIPGRFSEGLLLRRLDSASSSPRSQEPFSRNRLTANRSKRCSVSGRWSTRMQGTEVRPLGREQDHADVRCKHNWHLLFTTWLKASRLISARG